VGRQTFETVGAVLYWSYANLAMADAALHKGDTRYGPVHYMIRARLYKGLRDGTMSLGSLYPDERTKLLSQGRCSYCGSQEHPTLDHLFARAIGGSNLPENLVFACRSCNSSKGKRDVLAWSASRGTFLPLSVIRRYLKLSILHAHAHDLIDMSVGSASGIELPFAMDLIPMTYPKPVDLRWAY